VLGILLCAGTLLTASCQSTTNVSGDYQYSRVVF
jgi:hypothetical protein